MVGLHRSRRPEVLRALALLIAAAVIPACRNDESRREVRVSVHNQGAQSARVRVEAEMAFSSDEDHEVLIAPTSSGHFGFDDVRKLRVTVWRVSDDVKIFDDSWDEDDLRRTDDFVSVTVLP